MQTSPISLVTGGNRGIGLEVCRQLGDIGHHVILTARSLEKAEIAATALRANGARIEALALDVNDPASIEAARAEVERRFGRLDSLVNNAGIDYDRDQTVLSADMDRARATFETNTLGVWRMTQAFVDLIRKSDRGRIVNVSSGAGALEGLTSSAPVYSVSKAALNALTIMTAQDLKPDGILVNAICVGWIATDMGGPGGGPIQPGGASVVWGVTIPNNGPTGGFFRDGKPLVW